ncbi:MAG: response regulator transcription factor [Chloroflexota bacterium]
MTKNPNKIRVILADDHGVVRSGIRQFFENSGDIEVVAEAETGSDAKKIIQEFHPDVAVLDIQMPDFSGIQVTKWIREEFKNIGVLVLTAYDDDPYVRAVLQAGANGYILKTATSKEIIQAVLDVFEGKSVLDSAIAQRLFRGAELQSDKEILIKLTDREISVLNLVAMGHTNKAIGVQLGISNRTVQGHLSHIFNKLQANSRTESVMKAISLGWISPKKWNFTR